MVAGLVVSLLVWTLVSGDSFQHCNPWYNLNSGMTSLVCTDLTNEIELYDALKFAGDALELVVANSSLRYFVHGTFHRTKFRAIAIEGSSLLAFTNTDLAFDGLQNHLMFLTVHDCTFVDHLNWSHLREMRELEVIAVRKTDLIYISDMSGLAENEMLANIDMGENQVSDIHPKAFSQLKKLSMILLHNNEISSLQRSMFANPSRIMMMNLSNNLLKTLPADMFSNMPSILTIMLDGNQLTTISEKTFGGVFNQLSVLALENNPMSCDCRLRWITRTHPRRPLVDSECTTPSALKGQAVLDLKEEDLWC